MNMNFKKLALSLAITSALAACSGDDGQDGANGVDGTNGTNGSSGSNGLNSLVAQSSVALGDAMCFAGGAKIESGLDTNANDVLDSEEVTSTAYSCASTTLNESQNFNRIASFPVCQQIDPTCDTDDETAAEIAAASEDGMTVVYTDSPAEALGFVDISNPNMPVADGTVSLSGEPTSVAISGDYALVGVNTSADFINVDGELQVFNLDTRTLVRTLDLNGQPDSVAVSPDGNYAAVVIENERDEDLGDGVPPQLPAGELIIVNKADADPANWTLSTVVLTGLADLYASDPEPEYVDINENNIAVVTLQENNHLVLIDLTDGSIVNDFSAGAVDLEMIDATEEDPAIISQTESQDAVLREPDGVSWINTEYFATADEGDLDGGSRGFTIFNTEGEVVWSSGVSLDHLAARYGHYPDGRSGNKGNEPENVEVGVFGDNRYLFVNSERSSLVFVYDVADPTNPVLKQTLPTAAAPEGGLAIPSRNLLVVASEEDNRGDKLRSALNIYQYDYLPSTYPSLQSTSRFDGTPIPWSAMSGLSADPVYSDILWAVEDSFYGSNRFFKIDVAQTPARLIEEITLSDENDVFAAITTSGAAEDPDSFDAVDLAAMINDDKTVNIDAEGISKSLDGGFWIASEGAGTLSDTGDRPIEKLNFIFKTDAFGVIEDVITLPDAVNDLQIRFGFEGIAEYDGKAYVAFQRAWEGESNVRIGIYDVAGETWDFVTYELDAPESQDGGWVGLSDITALGAGEFLILERDNKAGPDAAIKRLYRVDIDGDADNVISAGEKVLVRDLIRDLKAPGGLVYEKVEGLAVMANDDVYIINDNDGVDDNSGETQLINLGKILD